MFRVCREFQYPLISFNVKSKEATINLFNRTKKVLFCDNFAIGMVLVYYWNEKIGFKLVIIKD